MKERRWIFFRLLVYGWLTAATGFLILFCFAVFAKGNGLKYFQLYIIIAIVLLCIQIVFNILNVRLFHYYLFSKQIRQNSFKVWHTVLLILNGCIGIFLILVLSELIIELNIKSRDVSMIVTLSDLLTIIIAGTYLFIMLTTSICSIRLRNYIGKYVSMEEDQWLDQLGSTQVL